jgi:hypothetical protein
LALARFPASPFGRIASRLYVLATAAEGVVDDGSEHCAEDEVLVRGAWVGPSSKQSLQAIINHRTGVRKL